MVLYRAHRPAVLGMMNFHPAVHVLQADMRSAIAQFPAKIVPHEAVIVHMQAEIVMDAA